MTESVQPTTENVYQTTTATIASIRDETADTRTLRLEFADEAFAEKFTSRYRVGMFGLYGLPGEGESTFCVASPPTRTDHIECTFRVSGRVTAALRDRDVGQAITFRGPYGNFFPIEEWTGRNIVFIAGGIGLAPVRSVICNILDRRDEFGKVTIVYGARTTDDLVYKDELADWDQRDDVDLVTTVDPGGEGEGWNGKVGFVPTVLQETAPSSDNAVAVICGPPIMIKFTLPALTELGFADSDVYTTLENRMKCGVGKCGRCNVGSQYVCKDGPVFRCSDLQALPQEF